MYSAGFEFNFNVLIRTFTTTGLQSTKTYTTIYNGKCGAWINNKAYNFNEDGNRLPESWTVMISPEDWNIATAGTQVTGATQTLLSGSWAFSSAYKITNQNYNGAAVSVTSVTGSVDGLLTSDDYTVENINGVYHVSFRALADCANLTTLAQNIVIVYDYTPAVVASRPWTYDWKSAEAVFNGITYKIDSADNPSNDDDMYYFNIYRSGNG